MATPADTDFVISQGDSLPVMRIPIPANSDGQLLDLSGCTVVFLGRRAGKRTDPPPIIREIESYASETHDFGDGAVPVVAVYVHLTTADTSAVEVPSRASFVEMQGELEVTDSSGEVLTVPNDSDTPYLLWWIRDDIGEGA